MNTRCDPRLLVLDLLVRSICKYQVSAVLADAHGIFAWGWNHPLLVSDGRRGAGVHAEEHAFSRANRKRLQGARLVVASQKRSRWKLARPCEELCLPAAMKCGIRLIEYTTKDGLWERERIG